MRAMAWIAGPSVFCLWLVVLFFFSCTFQLIRGNVVLQQNPLEMLREMTSPRGAGVRHAEIQVDDPSHAVAGSSFRIIDSHVMTTQLLELSGRVIALTDGDHALSESYA